MLQLLLIVLTFITCLTITYSKHAGLIARSTTKGGKKTGSSSTTKSEFITEPKSKAIEVKDVLLKNMKRLVDGTKAIFPKIMEGERLKKIRKLEGDTALTFTEFKLIDTCKDDFGKCLRLLITIPLSPELFFYSSIIFPMLTPSNPWAWQGMPSTFDNSDDKNLRDRSVIKRRLNALVNAITTLKADTIDDVAEAKKGKRAEQLKMIENALSSKSISDGLKELLPWVKTERNKNPPTIALRLDIIPPAIIKDCCNALGGSAVPNIPLVRRMNLGAISQVLDKIRESDEFIANVGVSSLNSREIREACRERCISIDSSDGSTRNEGAMRSDLNQWITLATDPVPPVRVTGRGGAKKMQTINEQNRRLVLLGLHVAKEFSTSPYTRIYNSLK